MIISNTAESRERTESRLEALLVIPVAEVLREEIAGLVKTPETGLELSEMTPEIASPHGETAVLSIVLRRCSDVFMPPSNFESDDPASSVNGRNAFGLWCGDIEIPLPSETFGSRRKLGVSGSDDFLVWVISSPSRSDGVLACWRSSDWAQLG